MVGFKNLLFTDYIIYVYSGTSLIRSPTGLHKSDLNGEVTILHGVNVILFVLGNTIWTDQVTVMVR